MQNIYILAYLVSCRVEPTRLRLAQGVVAVLAAILVAVLFSPAAAAAVPTGAAS